MSQYPRTIALATWITSHATQVEPVLVAVANSWPGIVAAVGPVTRAVVAALPREVRAAMTGAMLLFGKK